MIEKKKQPAVKKKPAAVKKKAPKRRRRKTRFHTGFHHSTKCKNGPAKYRSGWEKTVCEFLDQDPDVSYYEYEPFALKWCSNMRTGRLRSYTPDFLVVYCDGSKKLVEVKSLRFLNSRHVQKKAMIGRSWANQNNGVYEFWTDKRIKVYRKLLEAKKKAAKAGPVPTKKKKTKTLKESKTSGPQSTSA